MAYGNYQSYWLLACMSSCGAASVAADFAPLELGSAIARSASPPLSAAPRATSQRSRGSATRLLARPICPVELGARGRRALGRWSSIRVGARCLQAIESWSPSSLQLFVNADMGAHTEIECASGLLHRQQHGDSADTSRHAAGHGSADDRFKRQPASQAPCPRRGGPQPASFRMLEWRPGRAA